MSLPKKELLKVSFLNMSLPKKELLKVSLKRYLERAKGDGVLSWDFFRSP